MAPRGLLWQHPCLWFPVSQAFSMYQQTHDSVMALWNFPHYSPELWYFLRSFLVEWPMRWDAIMFLWRQSNGQISSNQILGYITENICFGRIVNELGDKLPYQFAGVSRQTYSIRKFNHVVLIRYTVQWLHMVIMASEITGHSTIYSIVFSGWQ